MSDLYSLQYDKDTKTFRLSGELSFASVQDVMADANKQFADADELNIDLHHVSRSDSTGIAILIEWMRFAQQTGKQIYFYNVPQQMLSLASACGMEQILPLQLLPEITTE